MLFSTPLIGVLIQFNFKPYNYIHVNTIIKMVAVATIYDSDNVNKYCKKLSMWQSDNFNK